MKLTSPAFAAIRRGGVSRYTSRVLAEAVGFRQNRFNPTLRAREHVFWCAPSVLLEKAGAARWRDGLEAETAAHWKGCAG